LSSVTPNNFDSNNNNNNNNNSNNKENNKEPKKRTPGTYTLLEELGFYEGTQEPELFNFESLKVQIPDVCSTLYCS
jgi:hypothetical protein